MMKKFYLMAGVCILVTIYIFYHSLALALLSLLALKPLEKFYKAQLKNKRQEVLNFQFRDLLYSLSASISAGRQMGEALKEGLENMKLIYRDDAPIVIELTLIIKRLYEIREAEDVVLLEFAEKCNLEDVENFVDTYLACRTTGGDVEKVVMKSADLIMEKITIQKEIHTLTAQKKFEAKILTAMPMAMIIFLQVASPDYLTVMYTTFIGRVLMTVSLAGILVAYYLSMKITDIRL